MPPETLSRFEKPCCCNKLAAALDRYPPAQITAVQFVFLQGQWTKTFVETRKRRIQCARHMAANVFRRASHVNDLQIVIRHLLFQLRDTHLLDRFDRKSRVAPALHAAFKIAFDVLDADTRESNDRLVNLRFGVGDHDDRGIQRNQAAGPHRKLSAESDVHRAGHVCGAEICGGAHVEQDVVSQFEHLLRC